MEDDWDLSAIVRSCRGKASVDKATESDDNSLACLASLTFEEEEDPFSFPSLVKYCFEKSEFDSRSMSPCCELQNSCRPFLQIPEFHPSAIDDPLVGSSAPAEFDSHRQQQQHQFEPQDQQRRKRQVIHGKRSMFHTTPLSSVSTSCSPSRDRRQNAPLLSPSQLQQFQLHDPELPHQQQQQAHLHKPRCRKRKNQQKRTVCHVTAENLSADVWAWRKYGQKPIKGSPYPRNYYRCSSSKGCSARKQVERSNLDPNIFIVTYSGDHTHPKPTHRNSLAGSTRNKPLSEALKSISSADPEQSKPNPSCSSPLSTNSFSPATMNGEEGNMERNPHEGLDSKEQKEDDILIPNLRLNDHDNIFSRLQTVRFDGSSGGSCDDGVGRSPVSDDNFKL